MDSIAIKNVKLNEFIKRSLEANKVYRRGSYDRQLKAYECHDVEDISRSIYIKANKAVFIGFTY